MSGARAARRDLGRGAAALLLALGCGPGSAECPGVEAGIDAGAEDAAPDRDAGAPTTAALMFAPALVETGDVCGTTRLAVQVTNAGTGPSGALAPTLYGPDADAFVVATTTCSAGLAPGASCDVAVDLTPTPSRGRWIASIHLVVGEHTYAAPIIAEQPWNCGEYVVPTVHTFLFDDVALGAMGHGTVSFTNRGRAPSAPLGPTVLGRTSSDPPPPFSIVAAEDTCSGVALAPDATCAVGVVFAPTAAGTSYAILRPGFPASDLPIAGTGL